MKTRLLSALLAVIASAFLGAASAATFDVQAHGHVTRSQAFCPDGAVLCGTAYIEGYGNAEYRWFLVSTSGPSGSCGPRSTLFDYDAIAMFTLADGSKLKLDEAGTLCTPGNSFPTGGLNSYGNPRFVGAHWQVVLATGQFAGLIGSGTSSGHFAGAAMDIRYGGALNAGSNDASIRLSWDIFVNGAPSTCEEVGASHIRVLLSGDATAKVEFDCDQKSAQFVVNAGDYAVEIELVDSAGVKLSVPVVQTIEIFIGDEYDLGSYAFVFDT